MSPAQQTLAFARRSDPTSSHEAAATCNAGTQRQTILDELARYGYVTADALHQRHPQVQRNVWSTRLSAMERAGLIAWHGYSAGSNGRRVKAYREANQ